MFLRLAVWVSTCQVTIVVQSSALLSSEQGLVL